MWEIKSKELIGTLITDQSNVIVMSGYEKKVDLITRNKILVSGNVLN